VALGESGLVGGFVFYRFWKLDARSEFGESAPVAGGVAVGFAAGVVERVFEELAVEQGGGERVFCLEVAGVPGEGFPLASAEAVDAALELRGDALGLVAQKLDLEAVGEGFVLEAGFGEQFGETFLGKLGGTCRPALLAADAAQGDGGGVLAIVGLWRLSRAGRRSSAGPRARAG